MTNDFKNITAVGVPGKSYSFSLKVPAGPGLAHLTVTTGDLDFTDYKHLLSDKPLRRPNRNRPID